MITLQEAIEKELAKGPKNWTHARLQNALRNGNPSAIDRVKEKYGVK